jgi:8-oxo-dGTP pyrophosphatase MutT (NUDIX family)
LPGGKLENNEDDYIACVREVKEEIGYDLHK